MNMKNNKKAVVFCSIAAELQGEKALADQENICRDMAKEDGCKVVKVINEVANKIGPMRKGLMILIDFIKKNKVNTVYVSDISCISRNVTDMILFRELLEKRGVNLVAGDNSKNNATDPESELIKGMTGLFASYERQMLSRRVRARLELARARGEKIYKK